MKKQSILAVGTLALVCGCQSTEPVVVRVSGLSFSCHLERFEQSREIILLGCDLVNTSGSATDFELRSVAFAKDESTRALTIDEVSAALAKRERSRGNGLLLFGLPMAIAGGGESGAGAFTLALGSLVLYGVLSVTGQKSEVVNVGQDHLLAKKVMLNAGDKATRGLLLHHDSSKTPPVEATFCFTAPVEECQTLPLTSDNALYRNRVTK